jgi:hypothetical protein
MSLCWRKIVWLLLVVRDIYDILVSWSGFGYWWNLDSIWPLVVGFGYSELLETSTTRSGCNQVGELVG